MLIKIATMFGIGKIPKAPGTWGSLATLPLCFILLKLGPLIYMGTTLVMSVLAIVAAEHYEKQAAQHDSKEIVIDECVGMLITMTWLPITWQSFVLGFILFRFFDILKPFPVSYFDRKVPGGFGVVADDIVAGIMGSLVLQVILHRTAWLGMQIQNLG
jgi:phosphatidylglycerophosphatase A